MKIFFDANVLLEVLLEGRKKAHMAHSYIARVRDGYISPLVAHLYVRFGTKEGHVLEDLLEDIKLYKITEMNQKTVQWAMQNLKDNDFEDALQIGSAIYAGCDVFVTFDEKLFKKYKSLAIIKIELLR